MKTKPDTGKSKISVVVFQEISYKSHSLNKILRFTLKMRNHITHFWIKSNIKKRNKRTRQIYKHQLTKNQQPQQQQQPLSSYNDRFTIIAINYALDI
ncbi:hypothetical protein DERP_007002 [Dermatophagoides pteronyssinus]|uniref:Uncharacterized protein n=1 Tax=Dermatophagoides pteronyssinus TaxID=6956 RepID=A0ABQ8JU09_DERPT|nr:hypothetical protein DERP_007002 [Dermatophagoides pteronyssinus]